MGWITDRQTRRYKSAGIKATNCDCYFPDGSLGQDRWPNPYNWTTKCSRHQRGYEATQTPDGAITVRGQRWG